MEVVYRCAPKAWFPSLPQYSRLETEDWPDHHQYIPTVQNEVDMGVWLDHWNNGSEG